MIFLILFLVIFGFCIQKRYPQSKLLAGVQSSYLKYGLPLFLCAITALNPVDFKSSSLVQVGSYYAGAVAVMLATFFIFSKYFRTLDPSVAALTTSFTNTVMIGIPFFEALGARNITQLLYLIIPLHAMILFGTASLLSFSNNKQKQKKSIVEKIPSITWALAIGLLLSPFTKNLPYALWLQGKLNLAMQISTFLVLGISLGGLAFKGFAKREVLLLTGLKLIVMPLVVYLTFKAFGLAHAQSACFIAALPVGINVLAYAEEFEKNASDTVAASIFLSTLGFLLTASVLVYLFEI
jgi:malonate transporter